MRLSSSGEGEQLVCILYRKLWRFSRKRQGRRVLCLPGYGMAHRLSRSPTELSLEASQLAAGPL